MRISDWSSDVCSSDLLGLVVGVGVDHVVEDGLNCRDLLGLHGGEQDHAAAVVSATATGVLALGALVSVVVIAARPRDEGEGEERDHQSDRKSTRLNSSH